MKRWENHRKSRYNEPTGQTFKTRQKYFLNDTDSEINKKAAARKVSLELLANDWLSEDQPNLELKHYLVENLLPSLVAGIEKLLTEVSARGLVDHTEPSPTFNPVNYLAQHLMRNNPKYSNFIEAHPYCRTMQQVSDDLKKMVYYTDNSKLNQLKSDVGRRRLEREAAESSLILEEKRREKVLEEACSQWMLSSEKTSVVSEVQSAIHSWLEFISSTPSVAALKEPFSVLLSPEWSLLNTEISLVSSLIQSCQELPGELVDSLAEHLIVCSAEKKAVMLKEQRRELFLTVFDSCDPDKTGFVDRIRVIHLFNCFYDSAPSNVRDSLHHPRKWPIVEVVEAEELEDDEVTSVTTSSLSEEDYQEFMAGATDPVNQSPESPSVKSDVARSNQSDANSLHEDQASDNSNEVAHDPTKEEDEHAEDAIHLGGAQVPDGNEPGEATVVEEQQSEESQSGSVIDRILASADKYGRAAAISAMRRLSAMGNGAVRPSGPGSSWDYMLLSCSQFVQLVELFLASSEPQQSIIDSLSTFIRDNYNETVKERSDRLELAKEQKLLLARQQKVTALFEAWDNDGSGYLELEELQLALEKIKGLTTEQARDHVKGILVSVGAVQPRLSRIKFQLYIDRLTEGMKMIEFEDFSKHLMTSIKLTFDEVRRGEKRKLLLNKISMMGRASGLQFLKAMNVAIETILEDNLEFGGGKRCSVTIALLEPTHQQSQSCLLYKAASPDIKSITVGRKLSRSCKQGLSFKAVDTGRPICVQDIRKHGDVYFFIPNHNNDSFNGSLVVTPVVEPCETVVGTLSVDSLRETTGSASDTTFQTHEISFFQGVGVCLGEVFQWIKARQKLVTVTQSALEWLFRRCSQLVQSTLYLVEPRSQSNNKNSYTLRSVLNSTGPNEHTRPNKIFVPGGKSFKDYLYQCVENSEPVVARVYGQNHLAYPIRDDTGCAVAVLDLQMPPTQRLHCSQTTEVTKALKLLTMAFSQLNSTQDPTTPEESVRLSDQDVAVLFDQLMLSDLKQRVSKLNNRIFAEMRSYIEPPATVLGIVQALLYILYPNKDFDSWKDCKQSVTVLVLRDLQQFDPMTVKEHNRVSQIKQIMSGIEVGLVQDHGSVPAKFIYDWVNVCLSLIEYSLRKNLTGQVQETH